MTEVRQHLDSRNELLITIPRESKIREFKLGECEYDHCGVDCESVSRKMLYHKLCCGEYTSKYERTYERLWRHTLEYIQDETLAIGKNALENYIEAFFLTSTYEKDRSFNSHIDDSYAPPNEVVADDERRNLARIWLYYITERGVDTSSVS